MRIAYRYLNAKNSFMCAKADGICLTLNKQFMFLMHSHKAVLTNTVLIFIELIPIA